MAAAAVSVCSASTATSRARRWSYTASAGCAACTCSTSCSASNCPLRAFSMSGEAICAEMSLLSSTHCGCPTLASSGTEFPSERILCSVAHDTVPAASRWRSRTNVCPERQCVGAVASVGTVDPSSIEKKDTPLSRATPSSWLRNLGREDASVWRSSSLRHSANALRLSWRRATRSDASLQCWRYRGGVAACSAWLHTAKLSSAS
mmetsp:Transcript_9318/g.20648  ORF Transcript_9318/g.20648 Transcript_9318/m.20648 type:complete len:205 (-) Transcript_9318:259-873(-)